MTAQQGQLQSLILEIEALLSKAAPRLPWVKSGEASEQRQILEQTLAYLQELQATAAQSPGWGLGTGEAAIAPSAPRHLPVAGPNNTVEADSQQVLQALLQEMQYLRAQMVQPLTSEVIALQQQREALKNEVRQLEQERLQRAAAPVGDIAPAWANDVVRQLRATLIEQITPEIRALQGQINTAPALQGTPAPNQLERDHDLPQLSPQQRLEQLHQIQSQTDYLLLKLDANLRAVFESLDQSIQSYCETLSQGLDAMHGLGQQGEFVFRTFINQLVEQLQAESSYLSRESAPARLSGQTEPSPDASIEQPPADEMLAEVQDELMDSVLDLDDVELDDLDSLDLAPDEEVTLFQLDEDLLDEEPEERPLEDTLLDEASAAEEEGFDSGENTIIQTEPVPWPMMTGQQGPEADDEIADDDQTVAYTEEIDALYDSLFGTSGAAIAPETTAPAPPEATDFAEALDARLLATETFAVEETEIPATNDDTETVAIPAAESADPLDVLNLLGEADAVTAEADLENDDSDTDDDSEEAVIVANLLGVEMAAELTPPISAPTGEQDTIASLAELLPEAEQAQASRQTDPFAMFDESGDAFIPAPPDEDLLETDPDVPDTGIDLTLDDAILGQLSSDLSQLEGLPIEQVSLTEETQSIPATAAADDDWETLFDAAEAVAPAGPGATDSSSPSDAAATSMELSLSQPEAEDQSGADRDREVADAETTLEAADLFGNADGDDDAAEAFPPAPMGETSPNGPEADTSLSASDDEPVLPALSLDDMAFDMPVANTSAESATPAETESLSLDTVFEASSGEASVIESAASTPDSESDLTLEDDFLGTEAVASNAEADSNLTLENAWGQETSVQAERSDAEMSAEAGTIAPDLDEQLLSLDMPLADPAPAATDPDDDPDTFNAEGLFDISTASPGEEEDLNLDGIILNLDLPDLPEESPTTPLRASRDCTTAPPEPVGTGVPLDAELFGESVPTDDPSTIEDRLSANDLTETATSHDSDPAPAIEALSLDDLNLELSLNLESAPSLESPDVGADEATTANLLADLDDWVLPSIDLSPAAPAGETQTETLSEPPLTELSRDTDAPRSAFTVTGSPETGVRLQSAAESDLASVLAAIPANPESGAVEGTEPIPQPILAAPTFPNLDIDSPQPAMSLFQNDWSVTGSEATGYRLDAGIRNAAALVERALADAPAVGNGATTASTSSNTAQLQRQYGQRLISLADMVAATELPFSTTMPRLTNLPDPSAPIQFPPAAANETIATSRTLPGIGLEVEGSAAAGYAIAATNDNPALMAELSQVPDAEPTEPLPVSRPSADPASAEANFAPPVLDLQGSYDDGFRIAESESSREPLSVDDLSDRLNPEADNIDFQVNSGFGNPEREDQMAADFAEALAEAERSGEAPSTAPLSDDELVDFFPPQFATADEDDSAEIADALDGLLDDTADTSGQSESELTQLASSENFISDDEPAIATSIGDAPEYLEPEDLLAPPSSDEALVNAPDSADWDPMAADFSVDDSTATTLEIGEAAVADFSSEPVAPNLDLRMEEIPDAEIATDDAFRSAFEDVEGDMATAEQTTARDTDADELTEEDTPTPTDTEPVSQTDESLFASSGVLATLAQADDDDAPPDLDAAGGDTAEWFLGIDLGSSGLSAVLMEQHGGSAHPLCWVTAFEPDAASSTFRLPTAATFETAEPGPAQLVAVGPAAVNRPAESATEWLVQTLRPLLRTGVPHQTDRGNWRPVIQWSTTQTVSLQEITAAVTGLLRCISHPEAIGLELEAIGLESHDLDVALATLQGIVVGIPTNWPDTYCFNLREAVLSTGLVEEASQIFFVEEAIAAILSGLPDPNEPPPPQNRQVQTLYQCSWEGGTVVISGGAACTEVGVVDLPQPLNALTREDFSLRNLPYGGNALDLDILCQLLLPAERRQPIAPGDRRRSNDGWGWQAALPEVANAQWESLQIEAIDLPQLAEPDIEARLRLRQHLEASRLGQSLLEAARYLKLILQHQNQYQLDLADQSWRVLRRDLESRVLVPYIQRLNQQVNALLSQTGLASQGINQVICTGGNASFSTIAKWLRQKFPNATIIQDTYPSNRPQTCSRVAYGLVNLCRYPQVLDMPRHQYSDYFLLHEILRIMPDAPMPFDGILHLLEEQGINTDVCHPRIAAILEGHLPPGLLPEAAIRGLFSRATLTNEQYQTLASSSLFTKQSRSIYIVNPTQRDRLRQLLSQVVQGKQQSLADPLIAQLVNV